MQTMAFSVKPLQRAWHACGGLLSACLLLCCVQPSLQAAPLHAATPQTPAGNSVEPARGLRLGLRIEACEKPLGVLVTEVQPGSAAQKAGVRQGDLILSANGTRVSQPAELASLAANADRRQGVALEISRSGRLVRCVVGQEHPLRRQSSASLPLVDAGSREQLARALAKASYAPPQELARRLREINVLSTVLIDPTSGRLHLQGHYDPAYASGPIDYHGLLADALANPYPAFSLEGTSLNNPVLRQIESTFDREFARSDKDLAYGAQWIKSLVERVLYSRDKDSEDYAELETRLRAFNTTPEEFNGYSEWMRSKYSDAKVLHSAQRFLEQLFRNAGYKNKAGEALATYRFFIAVPRRENLEYLAAVLDIEESLRRADSAVRAGRDSVAAERDFNADLYRRLLFLMNVPEKRLQAAVSGFRTGKVSETELTRMLSEQQDRAASLFLDKLTDGMTFSGAGLSAQYKFPPLRQGLNTFGARRDSPLMDLFFRADYTLKLLTSSSRAATQVPGHEPSSVFLARESNRAGAASGREPSTGLLRHWLYPGNLSFDELPEKRGLIFRSASMRVGSEPLELKGGDRRGIEFYRQSLTRYAGRVSENFDAYARVFPSLHMLRESTKVVALARWARKNGLVLHPEPTSTARGNLPETCEGFWGLSYIKGSSRKDTDTMILWAHGGVEFGRKAGEDWIQSRPADPVVVNDTLRQLAASAALSEQAAGLALGGDLDGARALAERGAEAMTGRIDLSSLPSSVPLPQGTVPAGPGDLTEKASLAQLSTETVDRNVTALRRSLEQANQSAQLRGSDPIRAEKLRADSEAGAESAKANLRKAHTSLRDHRTGLLPLAGLMADLRGLDPDRPPTVQPTRPQGPAAHPRLLAAAQLAPTPEELRTELTRLRGELELLKRSLQRLDRSIQMDRREFAAWEAEADAAVRRANERFRQFVVDELKDAFFGFAEHYFKDVSYSKERLSDLEKAQQGLELSEFDDWAQRDDEGLQRVADGVRMLADKAPIAEELKLLVWSVDQSFESGYDISAWLFSWKRLQQLDRNSEQFLQAVRKSGDRMKTIVGRINDIERQLGEKRPPPPSR